MKQRRLFLLLLVLGVFIIGGCAEKNEPVKQAVPVGALTGIEGIVDILREGAEVAAVEMETLYVGDTINTGSNGKAEITMQDDSLIKLAPDTSLLIEEYLLDTDTRINGTIKLFQGKTRAIVTKVKGLLDGRFQVHTPTATVGVRGTDFFVSHKEGLTGALVLEGKVAVFNTALPEKIAMLTEGKITSIAVSAPPAPPRVATKKEKLESIGDTTIGYIPPVVEKKIIKKRVKKKKAKKKVVKKKVVKEMPIIGGKLFRAKCSRCHILKGEGGAKALAKASKFIKESNWSDKALSRHITTALNDDSQVVRKNYNKIPMNVPAYTDSVIEAFEYHDRPSSYRESSYFHR